MRIGALTLNGLQIDVPQAPLVRLASVKFASTYAQDGAVSGDSSLQGLEVVTSNRDLSAKARQQLNAFGMADFAIDGSGRSNVDPATGRLSADNGLLVLHGLGTLHISYDLDGVPLTPQDPQHVAAAFRDTRLIGASLKWDDASLTGRLFALAAAQTGHSQEELRATLSLGLVGLAAMLPDQPDAADQVNAFLDGRHSLSITLAPSAPVRFADVAALPPQEKAHALGVHVAGN